jgi:hypothetical protein
MVFFSFPVAGNAGMPDLMRSFFTELRRYFELGWKLSLARKLRMSESSEVLSTMLVLGMVFHAQIHIIQYITRKFFLCTHTYIFVAYHNTAE